MTVEGLGGVPLDVSLDLGFGMGLDLVGFFLGGEFSVACSASFLSRARLRDVVSFPLALCCGNHGSSCLKTSSMILDRPRDWIHGAGSLVPALKACRGKHWGTRWKTISIVRYRPRDWIGDLQTCRGKHVASRLETTNPSVCNRSGYCRVGGGLLSALREPDRLHGLSACFSPVFRS